MIYDLITMLTPTEIQGEANIKWGDFVLTGVMTSDQKKKYYD